MNIYFVFKIYFKCLDCGVSAIMFVTFKVLGQQSEYTECPRRNVRDFGRVFLMLNYTDITQNTYIQS